MQSAGSKVLSSLPLFDDDATQDRLRLSTVYSSS